MINILGIVGGIFIILISILIISGVIGLSKQETINTTQYICVDNVEYFKSTMTPHLKQNGQFYLCQ